jgi:glucose-6-phosphate 1-dehydrogenase
MDIVRGHPTLFMRRDEIESAWIWVEPILRDWQAGDVPLHHYLAGSAGPSAANTLIERDGRRWHEEATA